MRFCCSKGKLDKSTRGASCNKFSRWPTGLLAHNNPTFPFTAFRSLHLLSVSHSQHSKRTSKEQGSRMKEGFHIRKWDSKSQPSSNGDVEGQLVPSLLIHHCTLNSWRGTHDVAFLLPTLLNQRLQLFAQKNDSLSLARINDRFKICAAWKRLNAFKAKQDPIQPPISWNRFNHSLAQKIQHGPALLWISPSSCPLFFKFELQNCWPTALRVVSHSALRSYIPNLLKPSYKIITILL